MFIRIAHFTPNIAPSRLPSAITRPNMSYMYVIKSVNTVHKGSLLFKAPIYGQFLVSIDRHDIFYLFFMLPSDGTSTIPE